MNSMIIILWFILLLAIDWHKSIEINSSWIENVYFIINILLDMIDMYGNYMWFNI